MAWQRKKQRTCRRRVLSGLFRCASKCGRGVWRRAMKHINGRSAYLLRFGRGLCLRCDTHGTGRLSVGIGAIWIHDNTHTSVNLTSGGTRLLYANVREFPSRRWIPSACGLDVARRGEVHGNSDRASARDAQIPSCRQCQPPATFASQTTRAITCPPPP